MPKGYPKNRAAAVVTTGDDDDVDDAPITQRRVDAASAPKLATTGAASVFALGKKPKATRVNINIDAVQIESGVPVPLEECKFARYPVLWRRMQPGDMVRLPEHQANALASAAKKLGEKCLVRKLGDGLKGVWKVAA